MEAAVPGCPGWTVEALVCHMGLVFSMWDKWVRERPRGFDKKAFAELLAEREKALPGFTAWRKQGMTGEGVPPGAAEFADRYQKKLEGELRELDPDEQVWTFAPWDQTTGFIQRRIAQETAIHRWDAQSAHGIEEPIDAELAADGVDEYLEMAIPLARDGRKANNSLPEYRGERFHFHRTDGPGEWLVEFTPEATLVTREHAKGDVAIRGTASDLDLFIWGRIPADRLEVHGDGALAERWRELAGGF